MDSGNPQRGGIGCLGVALIVLVLLKAIGVAPVASWSWWLVLTPVWIGCGTIIGIIILAAIIAARR